MEFQIISVTHLNDGIHLKIAPLNPNESVNSGSDVRDLLLFEDQFHDMRVNPETDLAPGDIIDENTMSLMNECAVLYSAVRKGSDLISYAENNRRQITEKLTGRGYPRETAEKAAQYLADHGYIDEEKQIAVLIDSMIRRKYYGYERVRAELINKGYDSGSVSDILAESESNYDDIVNENCSALIQANAGAPPYSPIQYKKLAASMQRYGYSLPQIKTAIREMKKSSVDFEN